MTKKEAFQLLTIMQANYPDSFRGMSDEGLKAKVALWADSFADTPFEVVAQAVRKFIQTDTSEFMPNIGKINKMLHSEDKETAMTAEDAFRLVEKALKNSGYHAQEEFNKLPPLVQKAVGDYKHLETWCLIDNRNAYEVEKSHFINNFKTVQTRETEAMMTAPEVRAVLKNYAEGLTLNGARNALPDNKLSNT